MAVGKAADAGHRALVAWLTKALDKLDKLDEATWDVLVCEHGCQTGSVTIWPRKRGKPHKVQPRLAISLHVRSWQNVYDALPDSEEDEDKFEVAYERMLKKQVASVKRAINDPKLKPRFTQLKRRKTFTFYFADEAQTGTEDCWQFLWGNRPPKREFSNSRELFTHLCRKASLYPDGNVRGRGEHVTGVTWWGHEFTDKYVDFLEAVENVSELCAELKNFEIQHTRVTPSGLARLQKMFPNANLRVTGSPTE